MGFLALAVGVSLYLVPESFLPALDLSLPDVRFVKNMWAARQVALGTIVLLSSLLRNGGMLTGALGVYLVMNIQDSVLGAVRGDASVVFGAVFFGSVAAFLIVTILRPPRQND